MESSPGPPTPGATTTPTLKERAQSHEPSSSHRAFRTPTQNLSRSLGSSAQRLMSASARRRTNAPTPHATAASNFLRERRAALTPKRRRPSDGARRESGRDNLRLLSRMLAKNTTALPSSSSSPTDEPSSTEIKGRFDLEEDDDLPIDRPNLTLPLNEDDEDDPVPPRSSILEGDLTMEYARRQANERDSRLSLGNPRLSEFGALPLPDYGLEDEDEPAFVPPIDADDEEMNDDGELTNNGLERIEEDSRRETLPPRSSDFGFAIPDDTEPDPSTFVMAQSSPMRPSPFREVEAADAGLDRDADEAPLPPPPIEDWPELHEQPSDLDDEPVGDITNGDTRDVDEAEDSGVDLTRRDRTGLKSGWRISKHGNRYPPFPSATVKRVAEQFARTSGIPNPRISKDTLAALQQASDWFFEQVSDDLGAYAAHAGRKTINESDMELMMRRQRQVNASTTMFSLATQHLPAELVRELRMPLPTIPKKRRRVAADQDDDDDT